MKHQKILKLLNEANNSKFVTRKWNIVIYQSNTNYGVRNEIMFRTELLQSTLCDYNHACNLIRDDPYNIVLYDVTFQIK